MRTHPETNSSILSRLMIAPAVVGLVCASVLVGYANGEHQSPRATVSQLAQVDDTAPVKQDTTGQTTTDSAEANDPVANYKTALDLLKNNYYGPVIDDKKTRQLTYEATRGLLGSLRDQFTSFLDPNEWIQMQQMTRGDFEGIGSVLQQKDGITSLQKVFKNSPAERSGLKKNDAIMKVDGLSVTGLDINDVVSKIKGKGGTKVKLGIVRDKAPLDVVVTRARVEPPVVDYWMEDKQAKIGHIVLQEFNEKSIEQMERAFADLQRQGVKAMVFDLRENPGGLLDVAIAVASIFIPEGTNPALKDVVVYIHNGDGSEKPLTLRPYDGMTSYHKMPLVVLVNRDSASASEIVSAAIKDYKVGTLIGERTFGKGRVQTLFPLMDHSALRLTTSLYFPPNHEDINFKHDEDGGRVKDTGGVLPNIDFKQNLKWTGDFEDKANDAQLTKALEFLRARLSGKSVAEASQLIVPKAH